MLNGTVVTPIDVLAEGTVSILGSHIDGVGASVGRSQASVVETDSFIFPGLIDLHDHITWNLLPRWKPNEPICKDRSFTVARWRNPLQKAGIEWEGWHGFRRGLATTLEGIGVLRHSSDRVTRKHYIKASHNRSNCSDATFF